jgi:DNA-binding NarL/FixJ family response regulator
MQPFHQVEHTDRKNQGTGLGLSISNRLLEMMGSHLTLESDVGKGTNFYFDLPQPDVGSRKLVHSPTRVTGYQGKTRKILIGEESFRMSSMLIPLLQKVGFEVLHLRTPETFFEKCQFFKADVVLIDLYFGKRGGVELMNQLQNQDGPDSSFSIPSVFMFSDHKKPQDRETALRSGANAFLGAPVRFGELLVALRNALNLIWIEAVDSVNSETAALETGGMKKVIPELSCLQSLVELTRLGNVRQLSEKLVSLKSEDPALTIFVDHLLDHCRSYKINAILQELEAQVSTLTIQTDPAS